MRGRAPHPPFRPLRRSETYRQFEQSMTLSADSSQSERAAECCPRRFQTDAESNRRDHRWYVRIQLLWVKRPARLRSANAALNSRRPSSRCPRSDRTDLACLEHIVSAAVQVAIAARYWRLAACAFESFTASETSFQGRQRDWSALLGSRHRHRAKHKAFDPTRKPSAVDRRP